MLLNVVSVIAVLFTKSSCQSLIDRPCQTLKGTRGNCLRQEQCPAMSNLAALVGFKQCGFDIDNSWLFCCEINASTPKSIANFRLGNEEKIDNDPSALNTRESYQPTPTSTSTPAPTIASTTSVSSTALPETACQTPNGEKAKCIPVQQCSTFINIIRRRNITEEQKLFLMESKCGHNNGILVCCGSYVNFRSKNDNDNLGFQRNALIPENCGLQVTSRIFGGIDSDQFEFPWVALLEFESPEGQRSLMCGGALISARYVLTAAHCVAGHNVRHGLRLIGIRLGEWDTNNTKTECATTENQRSCTNRITVDVESIHPYPQYNVVSKNRYHDIALIRLAREIHLNDNINVICLPTPNQSLKPGERLTVSGWGLKSYGESATIKQKVEVPIIATSECSIMFERDKNLSGLGRGQICAGGEVGKDSCTGDSGAPLMRVSGAASLPRWSIEGIVSFGFGCGLSGRFGIYTKVSEYVGWIHNTVKI